MTTGKRCFVVVFAAVMVLGAVCPVSASVEVTDGDSPPASADVGPVGPGQVPRAGAGEERQMGWREIMKSGGWVMYVLAAMSFLTVAFVIYFLIVLRAAQVAPAPLHRELVEKIRSGSFDDAVRACEYRPCPLSSVVMSAMEYVNRSDLIDPLLLKDVMEGEGGRQSEMIQGQTQYLLDIAVVSPMIGLLGTVFGMLQAFSALALDIANAKPVVLAMGVSQALITTAFGLIVGIPAMICYAFFRRRSSKMVSYLEACSTDILTVIIGRKVGNNP